jgi:hypothetical protein
MIEFQSIFDWWNNSTVSGSKKELLCSIKYKYNQFIEKINQKGVLIWL